MEFRIATAQDTPHVENLWAYCFEPNLSAAQSRFLPSAFLKPFYLTASGSEQERSNPSVFSPLLNGDTQPPQPRLKPARNQVEYPRPDPSH